MQTELIQKLKRKINSLQEQNVALWVFCVGFFLFIVLMWGFWPSKTITVKCEHQKALPQNIFISEEERINKIEADIIELKKPKRGRVITR